MTTLTFILTVVNTALLLLVLNKERKILMTDAEATKALQDLSTTLDNLSDEVDGLSAEVQSLQTAAKNSGNVSNDLSAAITAVTDRIARIKQHADAAVVPDALIGAGAVDANRDQTQPLVGQQPGGGTPATNPPMSATQTGAPGVSTPAPAQVTPTNPDANPAQTDPNNPPAP